MGLGLACTTRVCVHHMVRPRCRHGKQVQTCGVGLMSG